MGRGSSPNRDPTPSHHAFALPPSHVYVFMLSVRSLTNSGAFFVQFLSRRFRKPIASRSTLLQPVHSPIGEPRRGLLRPPLPLLGCWNSSWKIRDLTSLPLR